MLEDALIAIPNINTDISIRNTYVKNNIYIYCLIFIISTILLLSIIMLIIYSINS